MPTAEELSDPTKWMAGNTRYLQEVAANSGTHQQVSAALAFHTGNLCTIRHAKNDALELRLNRTEKHALRWEAGTRVRKIVPKPGVLLVMSAAESDIPPEYRPAIERAGSPPETRPDMQKLEPRIRICQECNKEFTTTRFSRRFCDTCRPRRAAGAELRRALRRFREAAGLDSPSVDNCQGLSLLLVDAAEAEEFLAEMPAAALPKARRPRGTGSIRQRGNIFYITYYVNGKYHEESSHSSNDKVAEQLLRRRQKEAGRGGALKETTSVPPA